MPQTEPALLRERFVPSFLSLVILSILQRRPSFGYEIMTIINEEYGVFVSAGSLYPILYQLDAVGLVTGAWDEPGKKVRKIYKLTPGGSEAVERGLGAITAVLSSLKSNGGNGARKVS